MTKDDVLKGARGRPVPFEFDGCTVLLMPLQVRDRLELFEYVREHGQEPGSGIELQRRLVLKAVSDESGRPLLEPGDLDGFALPTFEAIAAEVSRRNGTDGKAAGEPGKGGSPTTTS